MSPVPYPEGWRKVRDGSLCKEGDRYRFWLGRGRPVLEDWTPLPANWIGHGAPANFIVIRKKK